MQVLGTVFSGATCLYAINKSSGHGILVLEKMPSWLGLKKDQEDDDNVITKKQVIDQCNYYFKLCLLLGVGIGLRKIGNFAISDKTAEYFNKIIYYK